MKFKLSAKYRHRFKTDQRADRGVVIIAIPTARVLMTIFPTGKFGGLVNLPVEEEQEALDNLVLRLQSLGEDHPLFVETDTLAVNIEASKAAVAIFEVATKAVKTALTKEEMAKAALRQQYEKNYLQARDMFKRSLAERIFLKL